MKIRDEQLKTRQAQKPFESPAFERHLASVNSCSQGTMNSRRFCLCFSFPSSGSLQSAPQDYFMSKPEVASLSLKALSPPVWGGV